MAEVDDERTRNLLEGLVGEHADLYQRSVAFRGAIDGLIQMVPWMVDGLAVGAEHADQAIEAQKQAMMNAPMLSPEELFELLGIPRPEDREPST